MIELEFSPGQAAVLNDVVTVKVLSVRHGNIRIGLTAPKHVNILRAELVSPHKRPASKTP
ncbi:carbon storage regulator [Pseudomonas sp. RT6P73]